MNKDLFTFIINEHTKIKIQQPTKNYIFDCYDEANFIFQYYQHQYILEKTNVNNEMKTFKECLNNGLKNNLQLNSYLINNIGYYMNEAVNQEYETEEIFGPNYSILTDYRIWAYSDISTWIYNDSKKNIILEITPSYPYEYVEKEKPYDFFLEWMQKYKPIFKVIISKEIAQQWIKQSNLIINEIDKNTEELYAQGKF